MEYYSALKKEGNSANCNNMDEPEGHYAKQNRPDTNTTIQIFSYMWDLKQSNSQEHRVGWWLPGTWGELGGEWGDVGQRIQTSSQKMKKFWESNAQHGNYN